MGVSSNETIDKEFYISNQDTLTKSKIIKRQIVSFGKSLKTLQ